MRKSVILLLCFAILGAGLAGCGNSNATDKTNTTKKADTAVQDEKAYFTPNWSDEWKGLKSQVLLVTVVKRDNANIKTSDIKDEGIVRIKLRTQNTSEQTMQAFLNEAKLTIGKSEYKVSKERSTNIEPAIDKGRSVEAILMFYVPTLKSAKNIDTAKLEWTVSTDSDKAKVNDTNSKKYQVDLKLSAK
ncbi:hypothetical protein [Listeria booriae]|uniref:hypothetical protein n=1 Tax=Listeria booriae TaxID=1552123 RepID=UPI001628C4A5|nr:hypothetical protein [Listeria booriae]MBC2049408.1 hypothetical protein [Listeria booriae]